jgi:hypothetical protein
MVPLRMIARTDVRTAKTSSREVSWPGAREAGRGWRFFWSSRGGPMRLYRPLHKAMPMLSHPHQLKSHERKYVRFAPKADIRVGLRRCQNSIRGNWAKFPRLAVPAPGDASRRRPAREPAPKAIHCPHNEPDYPNQQDRQPNSLNSEAPPHMLGPQAANHQECERPKKKKKERK